MIKEAVAIEYLSCTYKVYMPAILEDGIVRILDDFDYPTPQEAVNAARSEILESRSF